MHTKRNYFIYGLTVGFVFLFLPSIFEPWGNFTEWFSRYIFKVLPWLNESFLGQFVLIYILSIIMWLAVKFLMLTRSGFSVFQNWKIELAFYSLGPIIGFIVFFVMIELLITIPGLLIPFPSEADIVLFIISFWILRHC